MEYKYYEQGTDNLIANPIVTYDPYPGDYVEFTDTGYSEFWNDRKVYTNTYKLPDGKHIILEPNGPSEPSKCEIKELTLNKLVLYKENITRQPGSEHDRDKISK